MKLTTSVLTAGLLAMLCTAAGCGGGGATSKEAKHPKPGDIVDKSGNVVKPEVQKMYAAALDDLNAHDKSSDWNEETCNQVAKEFDKAVDAQDGKFPEASYDAGLAYQRCGKDKEAKEHFEKALKDDPQFHHARAQLALYQYKSDGKLDAVITQLEQVVTDAKFNNVPALVNLAMFQMQRDGEVGGDTCKRGDQTLGDFECAKMNLQRALAIDDAYMPAFNQLALYYFTSAKKKALGKSVKVSGRQIATNAAMAKRADVQQLELAALVCQQAMRKDADTHNSKLTYAPIHNTAGLILYELRQVNGAVGEFSTASKLDPKFFEAHMNLAAVNLSFRGFTQAEQEYKQAIAMHANDYDAHLGLALAYRGQINDTNYDKMVAAAQSELDAAKKIDGDRPDAYFNEGILTQEYKTKAGGAKDQIIATYDKAVEIFNTFMQKAGDREEYKGAVAKAKERIEDIKQTKDFLNTPADTGGADAKPADAKSGDAKDAKPADAKPDDKKGDAKPK